MPREEWIPTVENNDVIRLNCSAGFGCYIVHSFYGAHSGIVINNMGNTSLFGNLRDGFSISADTDYIILRATQSYTYGIRIKRL